MSRTAVALPLLSALLLTGCVKGPNYQRPPVDVPRAYHGPATPPAANVESLGDAVWWSVFQDQELRDLLRLALQQNYDIRIAANRVLQAQESVIITRSAQFPNILGGLQISGVRTPSASGGATSYNIPELGASGSWTPDFWGKYRRLTEAARASLRASEWGRRAVVNSLVATLATTYFNLRTLDRQLEISQRTLATRQDSLRLTRTLVDGGAAPLSDLREAEQLVETAAAAIPGIERQIQQQENAVNALMGRNPGVPINRGLDIGTQPVPPVAPPAGIPSDLLVRRPDIGQAEENLVAATAIIGAARADFFPNIELTGIGGVASTALTTMFRGASRAWSYSGAPMVPLFNAGRIEANYRLAQEQRDQAVLVYQQSIQQAFRDVSDALIGFEKNRETREHQEKLLAAAQDAVNLAQMRYQGGAASYIEVLTNDTNAYAAELNLATALLNERLALVQLYYALGGGWTQ